MALTQLFSASRFFHEDPLVRPPATAVFILSVLYIVGIVGILLPIHPDFILLTPANLLVSTLMLLWYHAPRWQRRTWEFLGICYFTGFVAECIGVQTGLIFGNYAYGKVLGPKVLETPLMIGVNWIMLTYCAGVMVQQFLPGSAAITRAFWAAASMVALDFLIEPMAVKYGMWTWHQGIIPLSNYIGWIAVAFPLQYLFARRIGDTVNKVALPLFIWQVIFFGVLNLWDLFQ